MNAEERCEIIRNSRPILRYCERFREGSEKWDMTKHAHPFIELIYYMDGRAALEVGGRRVDASIFRYARLSRQLRALRRAQR